MEALIVSNPQWIICDKNGKIPFPSFKKIQEEILFKTRGKVVVYGLHEYTLRGRILEGRTNIILTHQNITIKDAIVANSFEQLNTILTRYNPDDVYLIGGAGLFGKLIDKCTRARIYVQEEELEDDSDEYVHLPNLSESDHWCGPKESTSHAYNNHRWHYADFVNCMFRKHTRPVHRN